MRHEGTLAELKQATGHSNLTDMFLAGMPTPERQEPAAA